MDLFDFPDKNINIPAGGVLLVTEKAFHESGSQLGLGYDILASSADQQPGVSDESSCSLYETEYGKYA